MVEYAVLLAQSAFASIMSFGGSAEVWFSRLNWEVVRYGVLGLVALRIATWAFRTR